MLIETRGNDGIFPQSVGLYEALLSPSASFGGLYTLEKIPEIDINHAKGLGYNDLVRYVFRILSLDNSLLESALQSYTSFDNPQLPVKYEKISDNLFIQQLYTGPTRAFKDMAMQPFGNMLCSLAKEKKQKYLILSATSGDTGPATLEAIKNKDNIFAICMYPNSGTSDVQRLQMTTTHAKNTKVLALKGNFDDAQNVLKNLLKDKSFNDMLVSHNFALSATNSVNFGRIVFQIIYHIHSYLYLLNLGIINENESINIIVPSGNFGNALGAFFAKKMGAKIDKITIATNANDVLYDFIKNGVYDIQNRVLIKTNSPAMDILKSSNVERVLFSLFGAKRTRELMQNLERDDKYQLESAELATLQSIFDSKRTSDDETLQTIREYAQRNIIIDPHTATALYGYRDNGVKTIVCSTAEWSKFAPTITKALGKNITSDKEALIFIANTYKIPIHKNILDLFEKAESNKILVAKEQVAQVISDWISHL